MVVSSTSFVLTLLLEIKITWSTLIFDCSFDTPNIFPRGDLVKVNLLLEYHMT